MRYFSIGTLPVLGVLLPVYRVLAYPHFSDIYTHIKSIAETSFLTPRDASNPNPANDFFPSYNRTPTDEVFLEFPRSTLNQSTQPEQEIKTFLKSSSSSDHIPADSLLLKSDDRRIVGVNGETLYASPINSTELLLLLLLAHDDLSTKSKDIYGRTKYYQINHTNWSFDVAVASGTLRYAAILAVVVRFLRLFPSYNTPFIVWNRVGCVYNQYSGEPIADVAIFPLIGDQRLASTDHSLIDASHIPSAPVQVLTISPQEITNSTEIISPQALDVYKTSPETTLPKRQLEGEVLMRVFNTGFYLTLRIIVHANEIVQRAAVGFLMIPLLIALSRWAVGVIVGLVLKPYAADMLAEIYSLESGSFRLGHLTARFFIRATARDSEGRLVALKAETYKAIANAILEPLTRIKDSQEPVYSVGGDIFGPDSVNGTVGTVKLGEWELRVDENIV
ncbi:MAG: hypothetical protein Q9216_004005 [Gyalolechia sp. 2 TL-2023]